MLLCRHKSGNSARTNNKLSIKTRVNRKKWRLLVKASGVGHSSLERQASFKLKECISSYWKLPLLCLSTYHAHFLPQLCQLFLLVLRSDRWLHFIGADNDTPHTQLISPNGTAMKIQLFSLFFVVLFFFVDNSRTMHNGHLGFRYRNTSTIYYFHHFSN